MIATTQGRCGRDRPWVVVALVANRSFWKIWERLAIFLVFADVLQKLNDFRI